MTNRMSTPSLVERERQVLEAEHDGTPDLPHRRPAATPERREAVEKRIEGDLRLGPRQRRAQAVVNAHAEGHVVAQVAVQAELIRVGESTRVAVGRAVKDPDHIALWDLDPRDLHRAGRGAEEYPHRTLIP